MLQNINFIRKCFTHTPAQIVRIDMLLDAIAEAVNATLPPAGQIKHRFPQGFGGNSASMDRNTPILPSRSITNTDFLNLRPALLPAALMDHCQ